MRARLSAIAAAFSLALLLVACASAPPPGRRASDAGVEASRRLIAEAFAGTDYRAQDPRRARAAESGELDAISAAWWGFDPVDSTSALEAALATGAREVIVPAMASPWRTGPLKLRSSLTLILEPGAELAALEGAFVEPGDCLLDAQRVVDLEIIGYGAALSMRKEDYRKPPYPESQWRHAIALREAKSVKISGLTIENSGGDGIYIGQRRGAPVPEDILLEDLRIGKNHRQGISVISARGLRIVRCEIWGTSGHLPGAGIDFEPNSGLFGFEDCLVRDCSIYGNDGPAILVYLAARSKADAAVDIAVRDCDLKGSPYCVFVGGLASGARGRLHLSGVRAAGLVGRAPGRGFALVQKP